MAKLIRELIEVPERVHKGDFVLRLSEGVERPEETLREYVVTPELRECFQQALDLVRRAVEGRRSSGAYLHGSFGSGKSHFMAVLHLLLQGHREARSVEALAPVVARLGWTEGKRFLLVPYHLLGAESLEQAILGHYVEYVRRLHPEAPVPAVYLAEPLFANADSLRTQMGDERFFAQLNTRQSAPSSGWGDFAAGGWNAVSYAEAIAAPAKDPRRLDLVSALVQNLLPAFKDLAANRGESFVSLDRGLSVISQHARSLGYDALVLFLDELILWLASRVADLAFVSREEAKLSKLVESETPERPAPILSFIARQRDLKELVGDHLPGAEKLSFSDSLKYSGDRFDTIRLEDRNLPVIAKQRLLKPRDEAARREIDAAFTETQKVRKEVLSTLLGREGNPESFRDVYPFNPALVQVLVAVSAMLQRERTALRVMLQLLVEGRETLRLGDLVPLGDLFDVIAGGDEPFTAEMKIHFDRARRLYLQKLLPLLERQHGLTKDEALSLPPDDARAVQFRGNDRLVKTLLLAALAPDVEALKEMTAGRLAALNHGSIRSPIPGGEVKEVLSRVRNWASQVGEIRVGEGPNPTIALQLSGVDTESILEKARIQDLHGNRKRVIKQLLAEQLGLPPSLLDDQRILPPFHTFPWRGTSRQVEVVFANVRELPFDALRAGMDEWKVIIDLPFDTGGHTAKDDLSKLESFLRSAEPDTSTFCWVPEFFSLELQADLGTYVVLDFLLTSAERFDEHASHLSAVDRAQARALLDNQRSQLKQRLISGLEAAYGVAADTGKLVGSSLEPAERFQSLDRRFSPRPPAAANLGDALAGLLDQIFTWRFPQHPKFEVEVKTRDLKKVLDVAVRAAHEPQTRLEVEKELRSVVRQIANPLRLGEMHESAFVLGDYWRNHLTRAAASIEGAVTVARLREALDKPEPRGLPIEVQDLVILVFAEQTNRSFFRHGGPWTPELGALMPELELREQKLPDEAVWNEARERASAVFGLTVPSFLSASNVSQLREDLKKAAQDQRADCSELVRVLRSWTRTFGAEAGAARLRTAEALLTLVEELASGKPEAALEILAAATLATTAEAMGNARARAKDLVRTLDNAQVDVLDGLRDLQDARRPRAEAVLADLRDALSRDELAAPLAPAVSRAVKDAVAILKATPKPPEPIGPLPSPPRPGWRVIETRERTELDATGAAELFRELEARLKEGTGRRLRIEWTLEERSS